MILKITDDFVCSKKPWLQVRLDVVKVYEKSDVINIFYGDMIIGKKNCYYFSGKKIMANCGFKVMSCDL